MAYQASSRGGVVQIEYDGGDRVSLLGQAVTVMPRRIALGRTMKRKQAALLTLGIILVVILGNYLLDNAYLISNRIYRANAVTAKATDVATGRNGVVASTQKEASRVGLEILQNGGNAIDAAVAVGYAPSCYRSLLWQFRWGWFYANSPG